MNIDQDFKDRVNKYKNVDYGRVFNYAQMFDSYKDYAKNLDQRKVYLPIPTLNNLLGGIRPSQVVTIIAPTNVGKTALAMEGCLENSQILTDRLMIMIQCEIDENEIFERSLQREFGVYTYEVENAFKNNDKDLLAKFETLKVKYENVISLVYRINVDEIPAYVKAIEEVKGKKCGLLIIDYLGLLKNKYPDEYSKITYSSQKLKEIALHLQVPILNLSQTSRADVKGNEKGLSLYSGKGSGEVENSSQVLITLDKVTEIKETDTVNDDIRKVLPLIEGDKPKCYLLRAKIQKKKQGDFGETLILFDKKTLRFFELDKYPFEKEIF